MSDYRRNLLPGARASREQDFAERNMAITPITFDAEHCIQLRCGVAVLCTVGEPAGPGGRPTVFHIWKDDMDLKCDTDFEDPENIVDTVHVGQFASVNRAWAEAVARAYTYAVKRVRDELNTEKVPA